MKPSLSFLLFLTFFHFYLPVDAQQANGIVSAIKIQGNNKTRNSIILRELPFNQGDTLVLSDLDKLLKTASDQLVNLNLFNIVDVFADTNSLPEVVVEIRLVEKWYFWPIPTIEYADRNLNQWYSFKLNPERVNYGLYNFWYNVAGLNHTFKVSLIHGYTRNLGLEYRIPYFDRKKQWGGTVLASRRLNHEVVYATHNNQQQFYKNAGEDVNRRNSASFSLTYRPKIFTRFYINPGFYRQSVSDSVLVLNPNFNPVGRTYSMLYSGLGMVYQKTDNLRYPTRGVIAGTSVWFNHLQEGKQNFFDIQAWGEAYVPLKNKFSVASFLGGRFRTNAILPYPLTSALGFKHYIRGYEPFVVEGNQYILFKNELRYDLPFSFYTFKRFRKAPFKNYRTAMISSQLCLIGDAGYVQGNPERNENSYASIWMAGAGVGWNWVFYFDKVVRFEYSVNREGKFYGNLHFTKAF